jgi:cytochrome P450
MGNLLEFKRDRLGLFLRTFRQCGDLGIYTMGRQPFYLANSAELVHAILVTNGRRLEKTDRFRAFARPLLGEGLLTARDVEHDVNRPLIQPRFRHEEVARSTGIVGELVERMSSTWPDGEVIDVRREMVRLVLWIVGKNLFDRDVLDEADDLGGALTDAIHGFDSQASALLPLTIEWPTPANLRYRKAIARLERTFDNALRERRASTQRPDDWLTQLLEARYEDGRGLTDRQIRDEALNMFMPGHETTATALTWTFHLLARHPDVYRRLQDEVDAALGERVPSPADAPALPYALQVFKEAMRLYPPVYMFTRQPTEELSVDGYTIPAGAAVVFSPYAMHRRADYFPGPDRFDPDRFDPTGDPTWPRYAYMPFGAGHRTCIGNAHALMSGQLIVAGLAQRVRLESLGQRVETEPMVTLRPRGGMPMRVVRRAPAPPAAGGLAQPLERSGAVAAECPLRAAG